MQTIDKADLPAARGKSDEAQGGPTEGATISPHGHESIGEYVFTTFKEVRRALNAAATFRFDYMLTRSTAVRVTERDEHGDTSEAEQDMIYSLQLFRTALGGDDSYDPLLPAYVSVLQREDGMDNEEG